MKKQLWLGVENSSPPLYETLFTDPFINHILCKYRCMNGGQTFYPKHTLHKLYVLTLFVGMVHIQQGEVVSINVCKPHLGLICLLSGLSWTHKYLRN